MKDENLNCGEELVYAYIRVSTISQKISSQQDVIEKYCKNRGFKIVETFVDKASGKDMERKNFQKMLTNLEEKSHNIGTIVVYRLDRLGRNQSDLINLLNKFNDDGINIIGVSDSIDTSTQVGKMFYNIMSFLAEYERTVTKERIISGIEAYKARGGKMGRPRVDVDMTQIRFDIKQGIPKVKIAKKYGIGKSTLYKLLASEDNIKDLNPIAIRELVDHGHSPRQIANDMGVSIIKIYDALEKYAQMTKEERILTKYGNENI